MVNSIGGEGKGGEYYKSRWFCFWVNRIWKIFQAEDASLTIVQGVIVYLGETKVEVVEWEIVWENKAS